MTSPDLKTALSAFRNTLPRSARLYVPGCSADSKALSAAFADTPQLAENTTFLGIWIPGINTTDWASLAPSAQAETIFLSADLRTSFDARRTKFLPLSYVQAFHWLETTPLDGACIMVSPPDAGNRVSLGVSADFAPAILDRPDVKCMAIVNENFKAPQDGPRYSLSRFSHVAEDHTPLVQISSKPLHAAFDKIGHHVASLVRDGDTLQFGLGNVQQAVLGALTSHKDLRLHAGMISDPVLGLLDAGAIADYPSAITTGVAIGTDTLYRRAALDRRIRFQPVKYTHAISTLAAIPNLKAINSCLEVDLFGQINAEFIGGRQISGTGGMVDFMRGAASSLGGMAISALTSTAKQGTLSRIVPRLNPDAVSVARADVGLVVTEHGVADLRGQSIGARAQALIEIADPAHQDRLAQAWADIRMGL